MFPLASFLLGHLYPWRAALIKRFPRMFPRVLHRLRGTRDLLIAGMTRMHLWPSWITPNRLSGARLVCAAPLAALMYAHAIPAAFLLYCASGVLDLFDGPLARLRSLSGSRTHGEGVTALGSFLDPMADKTVCITVCVFELCAFQSAPHYRISQDALFQTAYLVLHGTVLGTVLILEAISAIRRTVDYLRFRAGRCPLARLQANGDGKWKAVLQSFGGGAYVAAAPWSVLLGLFLLAASITLAVKSLFAKFRP